MPPEIAVVVPTHAREARLRLLLDGLAEQTLARDRFEVVVVRDGDQGGPLATAPDGLEVRFLQASERRGPTALRNMGWTATDASLIAFTDDDCRPSPRWLERLLAAAGEETFLQGRTEPDPDELHLLRGFARSRSVIGPTPWFPACNMAYPQAMLERLGGFDEAFTFGAEDTDLALRAKASGGRCRYVDDAVVWHAVLSRSAMDAAREALAGPTYPAGPTFPLLFAKHPDHRRYLPMRIFRSRAHAELCLGLAGAVLLRRRPFLAAALLFPYLQEQFGGNLVAGRRTPAALARLAIHVPARVLVDALEVVATARSAASHRVLLF